MGKIERRIIDNLLRNVNRIESIQFITTLFPIKIITFIRVQNLRNILLNN